MKGTEDQISKRCIRYFGAWEAEKEALWLNKMALEGWQLTDVSSMLYRFRRIEPKNWVYQLDFVEVGKDDFLDYEQLFADAGWTYVTTLTNWHYFRSDGNDETVGVIHSDTQSRIDVLRRVRRMVLLAGIPSFTWLGYFPILMFTAMPQRIFPVLIVIYLLVLAVAVLVAYSLFRLHGEIQRLIALGKE